jgi:hypothetical protein
VVIDPVYGTQHFSEIGYLIYTPRCDYFYYGFPFLFGHKKMMINKLTSEEKERNPIIIEGDPPDVKPDGLYLETNHAIRVKGSTDGWADQKRFEAGIDMVADTGVLVREAVAANPETKRKLGENVTLDQLKQND